MFVGGINFHHQPINDPIWGRIHITQIEHDLINTDAFNRLRQIKQMAMAYIGHIGAQHTRYEHSIGCMHVAYNLVSSLNFVSEEDKKKLETHYISPDNPDDIQTIRVAALLHDVGHAPLSHLLESAIEKHPYLISDCKESNFYKKASDHDKRVIDNYSHESFSLWVLYNDKNIKKLLNAASLDIDVIAFLISGIEMREIPIKYKIYKALISGDLDADRLDYINRDFYFCGIKQALDMDLFASALNFGVDRDEQPCIAVHEMDLMQVSNFLFSRYMLVRSIHHNKNARINEQAFVEMIRDYLLSFDDIEERTDKIINLHTNSIDSDLFSELAEFCKNFSPERISKLYSVKKRLNYTPRELTDGKADKDYTPIYSLKWANLHPSWRFYLSYVQTNKELIGKIEIQLSNLIKTNDFLVDFITSKPTKMDLGVKRDDGIFKLITEQTVTIPHALMITALQGTSIFIYGKQRDKDKLLNNCLEFSKNEKDDFSYRQVVARTLSKKPSFHLSVLKIIEDEIIIHLKNSSNLPSEIYLLIIMNCLKEHIRNTLKHTSPIWIKEETSFHSYLFTNFNDCFPNENKEEYNVDIYKMSERLVCWGLIDHIHKPIHKHEPNMTITKFTTRIDRAINQWGEQLIMHLTKLIPLVKKVSDDLEVIVKATQDNVADELENLMLLQRKQKEKNEFLDGTNTAEKSIIKKGGCVIKFV